MRGGDPLSLTAYVWCPAQNNVVHSHHDGLRFIGWEGARTVDATVSGLKVGLTRHAVFRRSTQ